MKHLISNKIILYGMFMNRKVGHIHTQDDNYLCYCSKILSIILHQIGRRLGRLDYNQNT